MADKNAFLDRVYGLEEGNSTREFYNAWSKTYDREVKLNGYATPTRCAKALSKFCDDKTLPLMDIGCGTGLSGAALCEAGFRTVDGTDFSQEMLAEAKAKGIYRTLLSADLSNTMPFEDHAYRMISAVGVLNPGHAPALVLDQIMGKLPKGGLCVFSLNDHALADPSYEGRLNDHLDCGAAVLLFREYGTHLPGRNIKSNVYVVEKT